jgi:hypothetical protein
MVATVTLVLLASCTGTRTESTSPSSTLGTSSTSPVITASLPVGDFSSFTQALDAAGFTVREGERLGSELFAVPGQWVFIDDMRVLTYEYPREEALNEVRSSISRDGYSVPTRTGGVAMVEWVATPHLYSAGRLLVLYLGDKQRTLDALDLLLGPQFAGG